MFQPEFVHWIYFNCFLMSGFNSDVILEWTFKVAVVEIINWHLPDYCDWNVFVGSAGGRGAALSGIGQIDAKG